MADLESRLDRALRPTYRYLAVTSCGIGVHTGLISLKQARASVERLKATMPDAEVERVQVLDGGGHRYWLKRGSRWVPWDEVFRDETKGMKP